MNPTSRTHPEDPVPRPTRALQAAYATGALAVFTAALQHAAAGHWPQALATTALAVLLVDGAVREAEYSAVRDQLRAAIEEQTQRETRARTAAGIKADCEAVWQDLLSTCCLTGWDTAGLHHDPANCTRKDTR
ncbi:hypothetical protein [Streptomyces niveus]|uniref:hypothetical protein n=1 Tax=Streptomyces niveus TaxID=193462 RepID=UPI00369C326C